MRLSLAVAGVVVVAVAAVLAVSRLNDAERYRQLALAGEQALAAGNAYAAIEAFSGAIALRADSMTSHLRRGEAYRLQKRYDEAARDFREAVRLQPGATDPLLALASLQDLQGDAAGAAEWYARAAGIDRQSPTLLYRLALTRFRSGQAAAAIEPLRQAITLDPGFDEALYLLGVVLRDTQDTAGAVEVLERAVRANPALFPAREELADLFRVMGRPADELAQLTSLSTQQPGTERQVALALAHARRDDFSAAEAILAAARDTAPADSHLALALGRVRVWRAERASTRQQREHWANEAIPVLEQALGGTVRRSDGLAVYGRAVYLRGDAAHAARLLADAVSTVPFNRDAFLYLADAHETLDQLADARLWLSRYDALVGEADRTARITRLGGWSLALKDYTTARAQLDAAMTSGDASPTLLGWAAEAHWFTGDAEGARALLNRAAAAAPRDPAWKRLRSLIR